MFPLLEKVFQQHKFKRNVNSKQIMCLRDKYNDLKQNCLNLLNKKIYLIIIPNCLVKRSFFHLVHFTEARVEYSSSEVLKLCSAETLELRMNFPRLRLALGKQRKILTKPSHLEQG